MITETWRWRFVLFWIILFTLAVAYSLNTTHDIAASNKRTVDENRTTITYLCLVSRTLDPTVARAEKVAEDSELKVRLDVLHQVLSETAPCESVEG